MIELPEYPDHVKAILGSRCPYEGWQRSYGLEYGTLARQVRDDKLFQAGVIAAQGRAVISEPRAFNLFLLITRFLPKLESQNIVEFGAFKGGSALFMAWVLKHVAPGARLYTLDTFQGMPETDPTLDLHKAGDFSDCDLPGLRRRAAELRLDNLQIVPGMFDQTFPGIAATGIEFGLAHLDADICSSLSYAQEAVWPCMVKGGYVVYDDATSSSCLGATEAVEKLIMDRRLHSEQIYPHFVFRVGL